MRIDEKTEHQEHYRLYEPCNPVHESPDFPFHEQPAVSYHKACYVDRKVSVSLEQEYVSQGPSICFFSNSSWEERYAAWLFYRFCTSAENSAYIATSSSGYDPVRQSSYTCDYYTSWLEGNADSLFGRASQVTRSISDHTFYTDVFPGSAVCRTQVGNIIGNVFLNTNNYSIDQLIESAFTDAYNQCMAAI